MRRIWGELLCAYARTALLEYVHVAAALQPLHILIALCFALCV
jgi:hypothetical protein